jgi:hypothetical protein
MASYSPPTLPTNFFPTHISVLDKSNASIANMSASKRHQYATDKLVELNSIATLYDKNGGANVEFTKNMEKMKRFYERMLNEIHLPREEQCFSEKSGGSRARTPISKLQELEQLENSTIKSKPRYLDSLDQ